jgi:16S rRNA (guanine966-N2)-methyltransferase
MRIISGKFKSRRLVDFDASHIRPTTDRVKETLFNVLQGYIEDARVLDLFAGTGNLGLECVSRGASHVDFIESHPKSLEVLKRNVQLLKLTDGFKIRAQDVFGYLEGYGGPPYDVIFADPPFTEKWGERVVQAVAKNPELGPQSYLVLETGPKEAIHDLYGTLKLLDQRTFGDKKLNLFGKVL